MGDGIIFFRGLDIGLLEIVGMFVCILRLEVFFGYGSKMFGFF